MSEFQQLTPKIEQRILEFAKLIDIPNFTNIKTLTIALIHPSRSYEIDISNEVKDWLEKFHKRLAHLGDAIYNAIVTDCLFETYPNYSIADLTESKKLLVNKSLLFEFAKELKLQEFCFLGKSEQGKSIEEQEKLFAEMFKAVFGAIYLEFDRDFSKSRNWLCDRFLNQAIEKLLENEDDEDEDYEFDEYYYSGTVTEDEYLSMIGYG
ncbi:hypothetical protein NIES2119_24225 [[Phormidium ambiguum] IAM M-71]|uniref:RNase III domain-containing protein n=1 Tax=[Phormidium ambiguum] IAM M-71 TaxID=454136 RepID=A0A1U7I9P3_9CYAN|nr:ribonuclease III domain-containing protein [Phormidium ambiguum]OKH33169.1 hypothetical protein NIES2119_24225 [Phormidium ambiguum IAM M-71]